MAEGQRSLPSALSFAGLQGRSAGEIATWLGLPIAALIGLVASLVFVLAPDRE